MRKNLILFVLISIFVIVCSCRRHPPRPHPHPKKPPKKVIIIKPLVQENSTGMIAHKFMA